MRIFVECVLGFLSNDIIKDECFKINFKMISTGRVSLILIGRYCVAIHNYSSLLQSGVYITSLHSSGRWLVKD